MSSESELEDVSLLRFLRCKLGLITCWQLVGFIANPNPQIRFLAIENLAPLSLEKPALFKKDSLTPIKHCKFLVRDDPV